MEYRTASIVALCILLLVPACTDPVPVVEVDVLHPLLGAETEMPADDALDTALEAEPTLEPLVVAQPDEGAVVAAGTPVRFLWRDPVEATDTWWVEIRFGQRSAVDLTLLVPGGMPAEAALDPFSATAEAWTPSAATWAHVVKHAAGEDVRVTLVGFSASAPDTPLSKGEVTIRVAGAR